ncbi:Uncharacterized conserved protein, DUF1697 family [Sporobacter termitidis DSM 10068]|uniref:Uncharacterized conserved protein, DUF1697 family n=1 Tax=Sporobacter termitidis DSM 10068 TaxID=1123282 RepID=A0A1M5ZBE6_9FIRM|nr:DUF1697 domain-containing protein [Sporobacter termitidis]SHI21544.1 Uncharacterized conserved protein, DUF1697 family [Sporobacter termitidis DSM 10068]
MPEKYCVFLRGVNVGGVRIKMDALKKAFAAMSFPEAETILATGNVIMTDDGGDRAALRPAIEAGLGGYFKYDAHVFLRGAAELADVLSAAKDAGAPAGCHLYYLLCDAPGAVRELAGVFEGLPHRESETFVPINTGAFWVVPAGETLASAFGQKALGDRKYKSLLTSRNINTIDKIYAAMRA